MYGALASGRKSFRAEQVRGDFMAGKHAVAFGAPICRKCSNRAPTKYVPAVEAVATFGSTDTNWPSIVRLGVTQPHAGLDAGGNRTVFIVTTDWRADLAVEDYARLDVADIFRRHFDFFLSEWSIFCCAFLFIL